MREGALKVEQFQRFTAKKGHLKCTVGSALQRHIFQLTGLTGEAI
jgi:hypothetical protein